LRRLQQLAEQRTGQRRREHVALRQIDAAVAQIGDLLERLDATLRRPADVTTTLLNHQANFARRR
jgi:hypothetical protein